MAQSGLSANEIAPALIPMMARSEMLQSKAGYIDARPLRRLDKFSCDARPDHTFGSRAEELTLSKKRPLCTQQRTSERTSSYVSFVPASHSQIDAPDLIIGGKLSRGALTNDAAVLQHVDLLGDRERAAGVLLDQQHSGAGTLNCADRIEDFNFEALRDTDRRLVE